MALRPDPVAYGSRRNTRGPAIGPDTQARPRRACRRGPAPGALPPAAKSTGREIVEPTPEGARVDRREPVELRFDRREEFAEPFWFDEPGGDHRLDIDAVSIMTCSIFDSA
jgi:hypothetical protein